MSLHFGRRDRKARERHTISTTLADSSSLLNSSPNTHMGPDERAGIGRKWWNKWISTLSISFHYLQAWFHNCRLKGCSMCLCCTFECVPWLSQDAQIWCGRLKNQRELPVFVSKLKYECACWIKRVLYGGWESSLGGQSVGHDKKGTAVMR